MTDTTSKFAFTITKNPDYDRLIGMGMLAASATITGVLVTKLNQYGFNDPNLTLYVGAAVTSALVAIATAIWRFVMAKVNVAGGVQAGINLAVTGNAIMIPAVVPGTVKPLPVTPAAADQIIKDFGGTHVAVADEPALTAALNRTQTGGFNP